MKHVITIAALALTLGSATGLPALAEPMMDHSDMPAGMEGCPMMLDSAKHSMPMKPAGDHETPSTKALREANMRMHQAMDITYTGDADVDFLRGMIAHHQGAVEMAQVALDDGKNPQVRRLARDIIRAQNLEIKWMKEWLAQLDKNPQLPQPEHSAISPKWHDAAWDGSTWMGER